MPFLSKHTSIHKGTVFIGLPLGGPAVRIRGVRPGSLSGSARRRCPRLLCHLPGPVSVTRRRRDLGRILRLRARRLRGFHFLRMALLDTPLESHDLGPLCDKGALPAGAVVKLALPRVPFELHDEAVIPTSCTLGFAGDFSRALLLRVFWQSRHFSFKCTSLDYNMTAFKLTLLNRIDNIGNGNGMTINSLGWGRCNVT